MNYIYTLKHYTLLLSYLYKKLCFDCYMCIWHHYTYDTRRRRDDGRGGSVRRPRGRQSLAPMSHSPERRGQCGPAPNECS